MKIKSTLKLLPTVITFMLTGCTETANVHNSLTGLLPSQVYKSFVDLAHIGDPTYDNCRRNYSGSNYVQCVKEADPNFIAARAEQTRQAEAEQTRQAEEQKNQEEERKHKAEEQNRLAAETAQKIRADRQSEELAKGYSPTTVQDFVLDGKQLVARKAKRSLTGVYLPVGNLEVLFGNGSDVYQFSTGNNLNSPMVHLLTDNASREFRRQLLACRSSQSTVYGSCRIHVLGTATMCVISGPLGNRRDVPCVSVADGSVGGYY